MKSKTKKRWTISLPIKIEEKKWTIWADDEYIYCRDNNSAGYPDYKYRFWNKPNAKRYNNMAWNVMLILEGCHPKNVGFKKA